MKKLEEAGIIKGYTAYLDSRKLGRDITAFVLVNIESSKFYPAFLKEVMKICEILECHSVTGEGSYLLKVKTGTLQHLKNCSQESNSC